MPEVLGDAAEYAAPDDVIGLAEALRRALDDAARRDALIAAGYQQASTYSWLACGTAFEQLYRQVAEAK
jgi:glycosyltransferase involved in cell wall biosynthesis